MAFTGIFIRPYSHAPSRQYLFGLTAAPHHGNIPSALQPRPITAIFIRPYSRAPSRRYSFGLTAAPYHGDIHSALQPRPVTAIFIRPYSRAPSWRYSFGLTAAPHPWRYFLWPCGHASRRYQFSLHLTAIIDFSLPLGKN